LEVKLDMAIEIAMQRLEIGDVAVIDVADHGQVEATVARPIERTQTGVRVAFRVQAARAS
jgi:hypothetical protein